jgi:hypothetical protein
MATTTPNFGWSVPTSTDLVKDGATAIETLGDSIDASMADLKGGTTGQILAKNSNTDMDFTWTADSSGSFVYITGATFSAVSSFSLPNNTFTATYRNYQIIVDFTSHVTDSELLIRARVGGTDDTSSNYFYGVSKQPYTGAYVAVQLGSTNAWRLGQTEFYSRAGYTFTYLDPKGSTGKLNVTGQSAQMAGISGGLWHSTVTNVDSMTFSKASGSFSGIYRVYGLKDS